MNTFILSRTVISYIQYIPSLCYFWSIHPAIHLSADHSLPIYSFSSIYLFTYLLMYPSTCPTISTSSHPTTAILELFHHNMWYLQKMALKLISTQNHLLQFLPGRGLTEFSFSTSTWRTDLVCFPYIQHIIANISMSTASSKIFRDHVKFHLPKYSLPTFPCQNSISPLFFSRETNQKTFAGDFPPGLLEH